MKSHEFAISVGGSIIIPESTPRVSYLRLFTALIKDNVAAYNQKTAIITGGGGPTRSYQAGMKELGITDSKILDTVGIRPTHINAMVVSYALNHVGVRSQYLSTMSETLDKNMDAWVTGGTVPGQTTDAVLLDLAQLLGIKTMINATNTPYIYEMSDGQIDRSRPIEELTWNQYLTMLGNRSHTPGENVPFGITAAHKASKLGLSVIVLDGNNLSNLARLFERKSFCGTTIHP